MSGYQLPVNEMSFEVIGGRIGGWIRSQDNKSQQEIRNWNIIVYTLL